MNKQRASIHPKCTRICTLGVHLPCGIGKATQSAVHFDRAATSESTNAFQKSPRPTRHSFRYCDSKPTSLKFNCEVYVCNLRVSYSTLIISNLLSAPKKIITQNKCLIGISH